VSDFDPFDEDSPESTAEQMWLYGLLIAIGVLAVAIGTVKWWRGLLPVLVLIILPSPATAQSERATHLALGTYMTTAFLDTSITSYYVGQGTVHEANPALRPIVERHGIVAAMTVKGAMHVGIAALILHYHKDAPKRTFWITVGLTAAQLAVDVANVRTVRR
jgi:hypothetical protein